MINTKQKWIKSIGVVTPGGDPAYECPVCGKGNHVYGIENNHPEHKCSDCGAMLIYPWESEND